MFRSYCVSNSVVQSDYLELINYGVMTKEKDRRYWTVMFPWEY